VALVWLSGSVLWWTVAGVGLVRFRLLLRCAEPAPAAVQEQARELARRLGQGRCPSVWFLPMAVPPMLWAWGRGPRVLLPRALWDQLSEEQRQSVLAHELAHWRRGDAWVRRLELLVLGLYWWHPLVWWARRAIEEAEEQCCDAWVLWALPEAAPAYAEALVQTVAYLSRFRPGLPLGASCMGQVPLLKSRLTMIHRGMVPRRLTWSGLAAVLGLGAVVLPLLAPLVYQTRPTHSLCDHAVASCFL